MPKSKKKRKKGMSPEKLKIIQEIKSKKAGFVRADNKGIGSSQDSVESKVGAGAKVQQLKKTKKGDR